MLEGHEDKLSWIVATGRWIGCQLASSGRAFTRSTRKSWNALTLRAVIGVMEGTLTLMKEYLFWDNQEFMQEIGLGK